MSIKKAQDRVSMLDKRLQGLEDQAEDLAQKMSQVVDGKKLDDLLDKVSDVRGQMDAVRQALDQARSDLAEETRLVKVSEDKVLQSQMDDIKKDNIARLENIDTTLEHLMSQVDDFYSKCKQYDHLNKKMTGRPSLLPSIKSYAWIGLLRDHLTSLTSDYVYQARRLK
jgi:predicted  nucleic acid-binding Zn-ribbon protein